MEHSPSERKPNRRFRGRMHFAIAEAFGWRKTPVESRDTGYEELGIGATTEVPRLVEPTTNSEIATPPRLEPDPRTAHWHNW